MPAEPSGHIYVQSVACQEGKSDFFFVPGKSCFVVQISFHTFLILSACIS